MARAASQVIAKALGGERITAKDWIWVVSFAALTAILAQLRIPLPFTPVPLTGQTLGVLLSGVLLGSRRAFMSQAAYLMAGIAGLPVFAGGTSSLTHMLGPTGGYLWSYPVVAGLLGWLVARGAGRSPLKLAVALIFSDALILTLGALWLRIALQISVAQALRQGVYPFLLGESLKIALVGGAVPRILKRSGVASGGE